MDFSPNRKPSREFNIKNSNFFAPDCDESVTVHDDEIVTYDISHEDLNPRPPLTDFKTIALDRPQTEQGVNRYNTEELFIFEEDDSKLSFQERLNNPRWQVRKKLYIDIADSLRTNKFYINIETELSVFEYFEPYLKDMAWDSNLTSQLEGLACISVYVKLVPSLKNSLFYLADQLIQKCALTKQKSGELVTSIIIELMRRDVEGVLIHYIVKRFTAKNPKEACFAINCVKQALPVLNGTESVGKCLVRGLNKSLVNNIVEVRNAGLGLAAEIFSFISDEEDSFIKNLDLKALQIKEFREIITRKEKGLIKWTFFEKELKKGEASDLLILEENNESLSVDLNGILPEGFFDIPYSTEIKLNREKLVKFTHALESPGLSLEKKDYPNIVNTLLHLVESNNNLIYIEAIKILEMLVPKVSKSFSFKYKQYIQFLSDKFKEKKKSLITSIFNILHLFRVHEVCTLENLIENLLENSSHKVPQVREFSLSWIGQEIQQIPNTVDLLDTFSNTNSFEKIVEGVILTFGNKVLMIALKDTVGSVRDSAARLLSLLKTFVPNCVAVETLMNRLPKSKSLVVEKKEEETETKEPASPVPDIFASIPGLLDKDQFSLTLVLEDIKRYSKGVFKYELVLNNLKKIEKESILRCKGAIVDTLFSTFLKFNSAKLGNKLETAVLELNLLTESLIREIGSFEEPVLSKLSRTVLQFPAFINKISHKLVESTMDSLSLLSSSLDVLQNCIFFISDLRLKKAKILTEEKALTCLKFVSTWMTKTLEKSFVKANSEKFLQFIDFILEIREQDSQFTDCFVKDLQNTKILLSSHIRKALSGDITPQSRSPTLSVSEPETKDFSKEIKDINTLLKSPNSSSKLSALNKLIALIEQVLANTQLAAEKQSRKPGRNSGDQQLPSQNLLDLGVEDLENFIKDVIFLCTKYKNTHQVTLFEELQQNTIAALTSLRLVLTDKEAERTFKQLLFHLPVKNSSSPTAKSFNLQVYQLFSDWLSHLATSSAISLISDCLKSDSPFNVHVVYIHTLQWLLETELKLGNFELEILNPICLDIAVGVFGGPLNPSHPLSHNTKQLLTFHSQIFVEYLIEVFTVDNVSQYFEEQLVNHLKVYEMFKEWVDKYKENLQVEKTEIVVERKEQGVSNQLQAKIEEMAEKHEETRKNLEEVNKEYLTQVTINYELMQKLEKMKEKKVEVKPEVKEKSFKPYTDLEDLLKTKNDGFKINTPAVSMFETEKFDEPVVPFYMKEEEVPKFQLSLLEPSEDLSISLLKIYQTLPQTHKKQYLKFLSKSLNTDIVNSLTQTVLKSLLSAFIQFCIIEKLASKETSGLLIKTLASSEDLELTHELQKLLGLLLEYHDSTGLVCGLFEIIQDILPESFYLPLGEEKKHKLKLILKFCLRIVSSVKGLRVFQCLFRLNQLFVTHPPESLNSDCSDVGEYEYMFKVLRGVSDGLIAQGPDKAVGFVRFIGGKSVYLKYLSAVLMKKYNHQCN